MALSGNQVTRLGLYGGPRSPYGIFEGKTPGVLIHYLLSQGVSIAPRLVGGIALAPRMTGAITILPEDAA
jgi:hypothetical protein